MRRPRKWGIDMSKRKKNANRRMHARVCHTGPVEVTKNLFCGSEKEALVMAVPPIQVDILAPLNDLDAKVWDLGFRGEILYCPIRDFGKLPDDVLEPFLSRILDRLSSNKKVGLFCVGGHGRTGYIASIVLGRLGYQDPIGFLREHYCKEAVESNEQVQHIVAVLGRPELAEKYKRTYGGGNGFMAYRHFGFDHEYFSWFSAMETAEAHICDECTYFGSCGCRIYADYFVREYDPACTGFIEKD